ncbi:MAG TPA: OmpA family protein [Myxococcota bacterium]|nr:OmpA family protein [Myxococcota bacterium]
MKRLVTLVSVCALSLGGTGCAAFHETFGAATPVVCAVIGGGLGAVGGGIASNWHHGDDNRDDLREAAAIGGGVGAVAGALLCALTAPEEAKPAPTARCTANPSSGSPPLGVDFRAVGASDAGIKGYSWDFGDGSTSTEANPHHTYTSSGHYNATCTVTDNNNMTGSSSAPVDVAAAAPATKRSIVLRGINFDFDKAVIKPEAEPVLDAAVEVLKENPDVKVRVGGHTDGIGTDAYNQGLSERRAKAVRDYLVKHGIDSSRLTAVGFGKTQPVADNKTKDGRAQNRRVALDVE